MLYKTIILGLMEENPDMETQLPGHRLTPILLEQYANDLQSRHASWKKRLSETSPEASEIQTTSEALELAIRGWQEEFRAGSRPSADGPTLDGAINYIRLRTPPA